jgi:hypothetical protein
MAYYPAVVLLNGSEFDVKFEDLIQQVERMCDERSRDVALANAKRGLQLILEKVRRQEKLGLLERQSMANALETVRRTMGRDTRYFDQIADIEDYVDDNLVVKKQ